MNLMDRLPYHLFHDEAHVAELQAVIQRELELLQQARDDLYRQMHPATATWGIACFEEDYGIQPVAGKPLDQRLSGWRAKRRGRSTTTWSLLRSVAESYTADPVEILVYPDRYTLEIRVPDVQGMPAYLLDMMAVIWEIRPAHLWMGYRVPVRTHGAVYAAGGSNRRVRGQIPLEFPPPRGDSRTEVRAAGACHQHIRQAIPMESIWPATPTGGPRVSGTTHQHIQHRLGGIDNA